MARDLLALEMGYSASFEHVAGLEASGEGSRGVEASEFGRPVATANVSPVFLEWL